MTVFFSNGDGSCHKERSSYALFECCLFAIQVCFMMMMLYLSPYEVVWVMESTGCVLQNFHFAVCQGCSYKLTPVLSRHPRQDGTQHYA